MSIYIHTYSLTHIHKYIYIYIHDNNPYEYLAVTANDRFCPSIQVKSTSATRAVKVISKDQSGELSRSGPWGFIYGT